jgi:hypothetical protein
MSDLDLTYYLPVSLVRVSGQVVTITDLTKGDGEDRITKEATLVAQLVTEADPLAERKLALSKDDITDQTASVSFSPDGRILGIDASSAGQGPALIKAGAGVLGTLLGAVVAFGSPAAGVAIGTAGLAALTSAKDKQTLQGDAEQTTAKADVAAAEHLPRGYVKDHPAEARVLTVFHAAIAQLMEKLANAALSGDDGTVVSATKTLKLTRRQAATLDDHFDAWVVKQSKRSDPVLVDESFVVDDLPTGATLRERLNTDPMIDVPAYSRDEDARMLRDKASHETPWIRFARDQGIATSIDYLDQESLTSASVASDGPNDLVVEFRVARRALLRTWRVARVEAVVTKDAGGNEVEHHAHYKATQIKAERLQVVARSSMQKQARLPRGAFREGKLTLEFSELGALTKLGSNRSSVAGPVGSAVSDGTTAIQGGLDAGAKLASSLVGGSATAVAVDRQLTIAKNRKELAGLTSTDEPDAGATAASKLRDQVEIAELEARLAAARAMAAAPAPGLVVLRINGS